MVAPEKFIENCAAVKARIAEACARCGRVPAEVKILPVTKNHPVLAALLAGREGFGAVGENRVREAADKRKAYCSAPTDIAPLRWELIGHLQSNKARLAIKTFDRIQSVDTEELAIKLDHLCELLGRERLPVLLQANAGCDPAKFGVADYDSLRRLAETAFAGTRLDVEGLMCVAPADDDSLATATHCFNTLREWRERLESEFGKRLPELSMGMSHDLEAAVAAGSTLVRIGTALFGERDYVHFPR